MTLYGSDDDPNPQALRLRLLAGALLALFVGLFVLFGGLAAVRPDASPDGSFPVEEGRQSERQSQSAISRERPPTPPSNAETVVARDLVAVDIPRGALRRGWTSPVSPATSWKEGERALEAPQDELALKARTVLGTAGSRSAAARPTRPMPTAYASSMSSSARTPDEASTRSAGPPPTPVAGAGGQSAFPGRPPTPLGVTQLTATATASESTQVQDGCTESGCTSGGQPEREDQDQAENPVDPNEDAVHEQDDKDKDEREDEDDDDDRDEDEDDDSEHDDR